MSCQGFVYHAQSFPRKEFQGWSSSSEYVSLPEQVSYQSFSLNCVIINGKKRTLSHRGFKSISLSFTSSLYCTQKEAVPVIKNISLHFHFSSYWKEQIPTTPATHVNTDPHVHAYTHTSVSVSAQQGCIGWTLQESILLMRTQGKLRPTSFNTLESVQGKFMLKEFGVWETHFLILEKNARSSRQLLPSCTKIHMVLTLEMG